MMHLQGQVVDVTRPAPMSRPYNVGSTGLRTSGCFQMVAGMASILLNTVYLVQITQDRHDPYWYFSLQFLHVGYTTWGTIGTGFWCGIPFLVTGILGMAAANGHKCQVIGFLVMCIISAVLCAPCLAVWGFAIAGTQHTFSYFRGCSAVIVMSIMAALVELFAAVFGAVYCCKSIGTPEPLAPATRMQYVTSTTGFTNQAPQESYLAQLGSPQTGGITLHTNTQASAVPPFDSTLISEKMPHM